MAPNALVEFVTPELMLTPHDGELIRQPSDALKTGDQIYTLNKETGKCRYEFIVTIWARDQHQG